MCAQNLWSIITTVLPLQFNILCSLSLSTHLLMLLVARPCSKECCVARTAISAAETLTRVLCTAAAGAGGVV